MTTKGSHRDAECLMWSCRESQAAGSSVSERCSGQGPCPCWLARIKFHYLRVMVETKPWAFGWHNIQSLGPVSCLLSGSEGPEPTPYKSGDTHSLFLSTRKVCKYWDQQAGCLGPSICSLPVQNPVLCLLPSLSDAFGESHTGLDACYPWKYKQGGLWNKWEPAQPTGSKDPFSQQQLPAHKEWKFL
jgi:hypothetical protein